MATLNYDPNARYDNGPNAAGSNGVSSQAVLSAANTPGLMDDYTLAAANHRVGFSAAGHHRDNHGPNVAGAPRSVNGV